MKRCWLFAAVILGACGGGDGLIDGVVDAGPLDGAAPVDVTPGSVPLAGFGTISGMCGVLGEAELTGATPAYFSGHLDFGTNRYDDPAERGELTPGAQSMLMTANAGGSSGFSEAFAYEVLARCELATFLKTETEIVYDTSSKKTDLLVSIDGHKVGVSVTRAVTFPFGDPYTMTAATELIHRKLSEIQLSSASVSAADRWAKQILAVQAYDDQHATVFAQAWAAEDAATKADTEVMVYTTDGDDLFIYSDN